MEIPVEIFDKDLKRSELKVIRAMYQASNGRGVVNSSMEELSEGTGYSRETIRQALRSLETQGLVLTTRKKRNFGKYHWNSYQLLVIPEYLSPCQENLAWQDENDPSPCQENLASTASSVTSKLVSNSSFVNTSYLQKVRTRAHQGKEMEMWKDEDDSIGGVGLFEEEVQKKLAPKKMPRRDPRTRRQRPDYEWTTRDTAAEFSERLRKHFPELPPLVNTRNLGAVLAKYRKDLGTNALVELELIDMFFADEKNLSYVARVPAKAMGAFLTLFKSRLDDALDRLSMSTTQRGDANQVDRDSSFIYSSDGIKFENNLVGRKALELHEGRLARNV